MGAQGGSPPHANVKQKRKIYFNLIVLIPWQMQECVVSYKKKERKEPYEHYSYIYHPNSSYAGWTLTLDKCTVLCYIIKTMKTYQYNLTIAVAFGFLLIQLLDRLRVW